MKIAASRHAESPKVLPISCSVNNPVLILKPLFSRSISVVLPCNHWSSSSLFTQDIPLLVPKHTLGSFKITSKRIVFPSAGKFNQITYAKWLDKQKKNILSPFFSSSAGVANWKGPIKWWYQPNSSDKSVHGNERSVDMSGNILRHQRYFTIKSSPGQFCDPRHAYRVDTKATRIETYFGTNHLMQSNEVSTSTQVTKLSSPNFQKLQSYLKDATQAWTTFASFDPVHTVRVSSLPPYFGANSNTDNGTPHFSCNDVSHFAIPLNPPTMKVNHFSWQTSLPNYQTSGITSRALESSAPLAILFILTEVIRYGGEVTVFPANLYRIVKQLSSSCRFWQWCYMIQFLWILLIIITA